MDTPSARLHAKLELAYPSLRAHAHQLWSSHRLRDLYPAYLGAMHMIVRSAVPLMEAALEQARSRADDDEVAPGLVPYLERHIREESGHDRWLLEDLEATGADPDVFVRRLPPPHVAELVGAQYYWLRHHHPVSLLGHLAAIESYHPPAGFAARLSERSGYPLSAFRAIARHERLDVAHKRELREIIDTLPLQPGHEQVLGVSALHTMRGQMDVLADVYAKVVEDRTA